jgi:MerR family transcriptional regulator, copper efflux regulator
MTARARHLSSGTDGLGVALVGATSASLPDAERRIRARSSAETSGAHALDPKPWFRVHACIMVDESLTVGVLARRAGVPVSTVHYYERKKLIPKPARPVHGFRRYPAELVSRLQFIVSAQRAGFSLRDIVDLLELRARRGERCGPVRAKAEAKLQELDARIQELEAVRTALADVVNSCSGTRSMTDCSILAAFSKGRNEPCPARPKKPAPRASRRASAASKTA